MSNQESVEKQEIVQDATQDLPSRSKEYLLMVNEVNMLLLSKVMPGIQFLQVEGMSLKDNDKYLAVCTPVSVPQEKPEGV